MKIKIDYTEEDIYQAQKLFYFSSYLSYLYTTIGVILFIGGFTVDIPTPAIPMIVVGFFLITYPYLFLRYYAHTIFKKSPSYHSTFDFDIDEQGVEGTSESQSGKSGWNMYTRRGNNKEMLILYLGPNLFQMIPKRVMNDENWKELLSLVQTKIKSS